MEVRCQSIIEATRRVGGLVCELLETKTDELTEDLRMEVVEGGGRG